MLPFVYSPLEITEYRITALGDCSISQVMRLPHLQSTAVWNLTWLSTPALDSLPIYGKTPQWFKHYSPPELGVNLAVTSDAIEDEALFRKLLLHPRRFIDFFEREDHSIYDSYDALGGDLWVKTVLERAEMAVKRIDGNVPQRTPSNVYQFARKGVS